MSHSKFIGIDYGTKRVGVALSDDGGKLAFPKEVLKNDDSLFPNLKKIIEEEGVNQIVIGESLNLDGTENKVNKMIREFAKDLEDKLKIQVHFEKEFMTSFEAHGRKGKEENNARTTSFEKPKNLDASAAALILQRYLDKNNNNNK